MNNKTFLRSPLNLSGMSQRERKAYQMWINGEEQSLRRINSGRITPEAVRFYNRLDTLCKTICATPTKD